MSIYGPIVTGDDVQQRVTDHIRTWIDAYLAEVASQHGRPRSLTDDRLPTFASYTKSAYGVDKWPEDQVPACIVVVSGLTGRMEPHGDGTVSAEWSVGAGAICSAMDIDSTTEVTQLYTAALRVLMLQQSSIGGFASATRWIDERYDPLSFDKSRTMAAGIVNLGVMVSSVLNSRLGPKDPPVNPLTDPGELGEVATADVVIERLA